MITFVENDLALCFSFMMRTAVVEAVMTVMTRFDMDYTLCEYISPQFDSLACSLAVDHLVEVRFFFFAIVIIFFLIVIVALSLAWQIANIRFESKSA